MLLHTQGLIKTKTNNGNADSWCVTRSRPCQTPDRLIHSGSTHDVWTGYCESFRPTQKSPEFPDFVLSNYHKSNNFLGGRRIGQRSCGKVAHERECNVYGEVLRLQKQIDVVDYVEK